MIAWLRLPLANVFIPRRAPFEITCQCAVDFSESCCSSIFAVATSVLWLRMGLPNFLCSNLPGVLVRFAFIVVPCVVRRVCRSFVCCGKAFVSQFLFRGRNVTNLHAALGRIASGPRVVLWPFLYLLVVWRKCTRFRGGNFKVSV